MGGRAGFMEFLSNGVAITRLQIAIDPGRTLAQGFRGVSRLRVDTRLHAAGAYAANCRRREGTAASPQASGHQQKSGLVCGRRHDFYILRSGNREGCGAYKRESQSGIGRGGNARQPIPTRAASFRAYGPWTSTLPSAAHVAPKKTRRSPTRAKSITGSTRGRRASRRTAGGFSRSRHRAAAAAIANGIPCHGATHS